MAKAFCWLPPYTDFNHMKEKITLSCTTFFRPDFSIYDFIDNFKSLFSADPALLTHVNFMIILNEYSQENLLQSESYRKLIHEHFPFVEFHQKTELDAGQARSLNIILDRCADADYHILWEEGWRCEEPFIIDSVCMLKNTSYDQIGITEDWTETPLLRSVEKNFYADFDFKELTIDPNDFKQKMPLGIDVGIGKILAQLQNVDIHVWPAFSLRPTINRMSFLRSLGKFNESPILWPIRFEYVYALNWLLSGGKKAMMSKIRAYRSDNKKSTYSIL